MSEAQCADAMHAQPAAAARRGSPRRPLSKPGTGAVDPRAVPCSLLGEKTVRAHRTMGPGSGEEMVSSSKWLRAHEKEAALPQPLKPEPRERRKAPLPARGDEPLLGLSSGRDFVRGNVQEAAAATPKYKEREEVRYVFKPHFGELPPYLRQRKQELEEAQRDAQRAQAQPQEEPGVTVISGAELEGLIGHLQAKWRSINEAYGRLPCVLDTPSTRRRKEEMEAQLAEIERDVRMLGRATSVRVASG